MSPALAVFLSLLAALVLANVWATRRVLRSHEFGNRKALMVVGIWIMPFLGAFMARYQFAPPADSLPAGPALPGQGGEQPPAPETLRMASLAPFEVRDHLSAPADLPRMDWQALDHWAGQAASPEAATEAITQGRRAWLLHLRDAIGPHMHLHESPDVSILSPLEPAVAQAMAGYVGKTRQRIARVLDGVARFNPGEKSVLLVLESEELYYRYVGQFYPDGGEFAFSGGMFIHNGCPHFVVVQADLSTIEPVIAHELTHSALSYLRLPTWLDEGLAVNTEHRLTGARRPAQTPQAMHQRHLAFWNAERVQEFWSGDSFHRTDDGNALSYDLARIAVEQMARDWPAFSRFATSARRSDAGAEAAASALGIDLGSYIGALVQATEDWAPHPATWPTQPAQQAAHLHF
ncbi:MAG: hypothetical protein V4679_18345 [Pseudomonadota bacterium]